MINLLSINSSEKIISKTNHINFMSNLESNYNSINLSSLEINITNSNVSDTIPVMSNTRDSCFSQNYESNAERIKNGPKIESNAERIKNGPKIESNAERIKNGPKIEWRGKAMAVELEGSFTKPPWNKRYTLDPIGVDYFIFDVYKQVGQLLPGIHSFRIYADGKWVQATGSPMLEDEDGYINNVIVISENGCDDTETESDQTLDPTSGIPLGGSSDLPLGVPLGVNQMSPQGGCRLSDQVFDQILSLCRHNHSLK
eukprot:GHVL01025665.1.p1 GENE.GHVL01025665.1~~GHVL01025665.1.p1  ORF type:complete len:256 (+),score=48.69 GHVL01025665.1:119-886(+)